MALTRLRQGNSQFPAEKEIGDVVVLSSGDIFCYDGGIWQLIGGRFLPRALRDGFLSYLSSGWPDSESALFDLATLLDLECFNSYTDEEEKLGKIAYEDFVEKFKLRVLEVAARCEKALKNPG